MVTKNTSKEDVKKVSAPVEQKPSVKNEKNATETSVAKPAKIKSTAAKTKRAAVKNSVVPSVENKDVVSSVLETKSKNEAKKAGKAVRTKTVKTVSNEISAEENKGVKAVYVKNKRQAAKANAQKAEAKKFMTMKDEASEQNVCLHKCCICEGVKNMFAAWIDGYKKIFDYKSRTNRYEFWAFMLINLIFTILISIPYQRANMTAMFTGEDFKFVYFLAYWAFVIVEMLIYLSLYVRRLHDTGADGWKGYFRPLTYSALAIIALVAVGQQISPAATDLSYHPGMRESLLGLALIILLLINLYYLCKTFIGAGFVEEDREDNAYGTAKLLDSCRKGKFLRYAALYITFMSIYMIAIWVFIYYMSLAAILQ